MRVANNSQDKNEKIGSNHTSYCPSLLGILATDEEDHVPLAGIDIVVLQEEDLVDTIFLKCTEFDEETNCPSERLFNDKVLLASDLEFISCCAWQDRSP